jgi:hypothetical protein
MKNSTRTYSIVYDPAWLITGAFFALLTSALGVLLGLSWLMPLMQTVALWLLLLPALRTGALRPTLKMLSLWVLLQGLTVFLAATFAPARAETAIGDGFAYQTSLLAWLYTQSPLPASWATQPLLRVVELLGVVVGTALTGGLLGIWFLLRSLNLYAFGAGMVLATSESAAVLLAALEPWWLLRLIAYILLIAALAMPGFTGEYSPAAWPARRRKALWWGLALLGAALLIEPLLATPWARLLGGGA